MLYVKKPGDLARASPGFLVQWFKFRKRNRAAVTHLGADGSTVGGRHGHARAELRPLPPGANRDDLTTAFRGWRIVNEHPYEGVLPRALKSIAPQWYRLARA